YSAYGTLTNKLQNLPAKISHNNILPCSKERDFVKKFTPVLIISASVAIIFMLCGAIAQPNVDAVSGRAQSFMQERYGWFYVGWGSVIMLFTIYLAFSKYGHIKLRSDDDEPEYSTFSWIAMLFSAGMGIGVVFWGVAEPVSHYYVPPMEVRKHQR